MTTPTTSVDAKRALAISLSMGATSGLIFAALLWRAWSFGPLSRVLPIVVGAGGLAAAIGFTARTLLRLRALAAASAAVPRDEAAGVAREATESRPRDSTLFRYLIWYGMFLVSFVLLDWRIAIAAFLVGYLKVEARETWPKAIAAGAMTLAGVMAVDYVFDLALPESRFVG